jgi:hypothetical protein
MANCGCHGAPSARVRWMMSYGILGCAPGAVNGSEEGKSQLHPKWATTENLTESRERTRTPIPGPHNQAAPATFVFIRSRRPAWNSVSSHRLGQPSQITRSNHLFDCASESTAGFSGSRSNCHRGRVGRDLRSSPTVSRPSWEVYRHQQALPKLCSYFDTEQYHIPHAKSGEQPCTRYVRKSLIRQARAPTIISLDLVDPATQIAISHPSKHSVLRSPVQSFGDRTIFVFPVPTAPRWSEMNSPYGFGTPRNAADLNPFNG